MIKKNAGDGWVIANLINTINNAKELEDKLEREREKNLALQIKIAMMQQNEEKIKKLKEKCRLLKLKK